MSKLKFTPKWATVAVWSKAALRLSPWQGTPGSYPGVAVIAAMHGCKNACDRPLPTGPRAAYKPVVTTLKMK